MLVLGLALIYISVHVAKAGIDRPRPTGLARGHERRGYPERPRRIRDGMGGRRGGLTRRLRLVASSVLVFVALAIAAAVGLTRVYLRAHWWSDVAGGWGLGAGIFALVGAIALVVEYIRHNGAAG